MDITTELIMTHALTFLSTLLMTAVACVTVARRHAARLRDVHASEMETMKQMQRVKEQEIVEKAAVIVDLQHQVVQLEERYQAELRRGEERLSDLKQAREQLSMEFKTLADEILETKSKKFTEQNSINLASLLTPLQSQIAEFRGQMEMTNTEQTKDRASLKTEIELIRSLNSQMTEEAQNLTRALKNETKTQGIWGEMILERLLEASGLRKGIEYDREVHHVDELGKRKRPDVIINMPDAKHVIVDSKVSLKAYEKYCSVASEDERQTALEEHVQSLKRHVKLLSDKNYEHLPDVNSIDFVLMFVPLDPAYIAAASCCTDLMMEAFEKRIIIVGPSTLLATLRTIQNVWRYEHQNRNAILIAEEAGKLYDKFVAFSENLEKVGHHLNKAQEAFVGTKSQLTEGRGNIVRRVETLKDLGAKAKKQIDKTLIEDAIENSPVLSIAKTHF